MSLQKIYSAISLSHFRPSRKLILGLFLFQAIFALILWHASVSSWPANPSTYGSGTGLKGASAGLEKVKSGRGGRWHIPQAWADHDSPNSGCDTRNMTDIVDAAECALRFALINDAFMNNSRIPLIVHQTSRSANPKTWSSVIRDCVELWVSAATARNDPPAVETAWFMWDDDGVDALVEKYENDMYPAFSTLPYPVEKADVFRVLVLKWFGGVYADIDAQPLAHLSGWIHPGDLEDWSDEEGNNHTQYQPSHQAYVIPNGAPGIYMSRTGVLMAEKGATDKTVSAVFGLEADNPPEPDDTYWRMGYTFPVQITNWAMAMSPHHPVADLFLTDVAARILANVHHLRAIDPLNITGPPALTHVVKDHSERTEPGFAWQSVSSRGRSTASGRGKIVAGDTLILPITGFSPGRGWFHNMGSQPKDHPSARLEHLAAGSWRKPDLKVTYGKLCRTVFGLCREWSKIPDP